MYILTTLRNKKMGNNKIAVMTGATSGFGLEIAKHLVQLNYHLIFLARSEEKSRQLIKTLSKENIQKNIEFINCDLSSFQSINDASIQILEKCAHIDLLILNAGIWNFKYLESRDKIEETLQVNLLSPIFLFLKIESLLSLSSDAKVIFTASGLHQGKIQFDNIEFKNNFSGFKSYRQSKLGIILTTRYLAQLPKYHSFSFYSVHPGMVNTNLGKNAGWLSRTIFKLLGTSIQKGAKTHIHLIDTPNEKLISGEYYAKSKIKKTTSEANNLLEAEKLFKTIKNYISPFMK